MVGTLGLQSLRKNHSGATMKRAKKAKLTEAPTGDSGSSRSQPPRSSQPQNLQKPSTPGAQGKTKRRTKQEPSLAGPESSEGKGHLKGPGKWQRPSKGTPEGGQAEAQAGWAAYLHQGHLGGHSDGNCGRGLSRDSDLRTELC
jgi:hypothetical protein